MAAGMSLAAAPRASLRCGDAFAIVDGIIAGPSLAPPGTICGTDCEHELPCLWNNQSLRLVSKVDVVVYGILRRLADVGAAIRARTFCEDG